MSAHIRYAISLALAAAASLSLPAAPALADTYQLTTVGTSQSASFLGIDNVGDFTVNLGSVPACGTAYNAPTCFETFYEGSDKPIFTTSAPALTFDNGSPCKPSISGFRIASGLCNGDRFLAAGVHTLPDKSEVRGIWAGPVADPFTDPLSNGSIDGGFINSNGDAVFIDGLHNILVFADNLSTNITPEPSSLVLLGTGGIAAFAAVRRRFTR